MCVCVFWLHDATLCTAGCTDGGLLAYYTPVLRMLRIFYYTAEQLDKLFDDTQPRAQDVVTLAASLQRGLCVAGQRLFAQPSDGMTERAIRARLNCVTTCKASTSLSAEIRAAVLHGTGIFDAFVVVTTSDVFKHVLDGSKLPRDKVTFVDIKGDVPAGDVLPASSRTLLIVAISPSVARWASETLDAGVEGFNLLGAARSVCQAVHVTDVLVLVSEPAWQHFKPATAATELASDITRLQLAFHTGSAVCFYDLLDLRVRSSGTCGCRTCSRGLVGTPKFVAVPIMGMFGQLWEDDPSLSFTLLKLIRMIDGHPSVRSDSRVVKAVDQAVSFLHIDRQQVVPCFHAHVLAHRLDVNKLAAAQFADMSFSVLALPEHADSVAPPAEPAPQSVTANALRPQLTSPIDDDYTRRACAVVQAIANIDGMADACAEHSVDCTVIDCLVCHLRADARDSRAKQKVSATIAHLR